MERPTLQVLEFCQTPEISPAIALLPLIVEANWNDDLTPEQMLNEIREGHIWLWTVRGVERGVVLLRIEQSPQRKVLLLDGLAGDNVVGKGQAIGADLRTIAKFYGCTAIETAAHDPRWNFVAKRLGFTPVSVVYSQKVT